MKKKLTLVVSLLLVMALSIGGTLAYLTYTTEAITNTFSIGNIELTLKEMIKNADGTEVEATTAEQKSFTVVPGGSDAKKPIITVKAKSEACWLYAYVENNVLVAVGGTQTPVATLDIGSDWIVVAQNADKTKTLYRYTNDAVATSDADQPFTVFTTVSYDGAKITKDNRADITSADTIVVNAFAHQSANVEKAVADATAKTQFGFTTNP